MAAWVAWVFGVLGFTCLCALACSGTAPRRRGAVGAATLGLLAPLWAPDPPLLRALVALLLIWSWAKLRDMSVDPTPRSPRFRMAQMLVLYDLRLDESEQLGRGRTSANQVLFALLIGGGAALAFELLSPAQSWFSGTRHGLVALAAGATFTYLFVEFVARVALAVYQACGLRPPQLHDHPILSRSIAEFWGQRWNRMVGRWLRQNYFRPLAERGHPELGMVAAFVASAALHFYFSWLAVGMTAGLSMAAFFLLQIPVLALERRLPFSRLPSILQRTWTLSWLIALSPLFVAPLLEILGAT